MRTQASRWWAHYAHAAIITKNVSMHTWFTTVKLERRKNRAMHELCAVVESVIVTRRQKPSAKWSNNCETSGKVKGGMCESMSIKQKTEKTKRNIEHRFEVSRLTYFHLSNFPHHLKCINNHRYALWMLSKEYLHWEGMQYVNWNLCFQRTGELVFVSIQWNFNANVIISVNQPTKQR